MASSTGNSSISIEPLARRRYVEKLRASNFRAVSYPTAARCAAAYYPEANVLIPTNSVADESGTPTSKGVVVSLVAAATG